MNNTNDQTNNNYSETLQNKCKCMFARSRRLFAYLICRITRRCVVYTLHYIIWGTQLTRKWMRCDCRAASEKQDSILNYIYSTSYTSYIILCSWARQLIKQFFLPGRKHNMYEIFHVTYRMTHAAIFELYLFCMYMLFWLFAHKHLRSLPFYMLHVLFISTKVRFIFKSFHRMLVSLNDRYTGFPFTEIPNDKQDLRRRI